MQMAARQRSEQPNAPVRTQLEEALRAALAPHLAVGRKTSTELLETVIGSTLDTLKERFIVGLRQPRPRKETHRALVQRLPEMGVTFDHMHKNKRYTVRVVGERQVELEMEGKVELHRTLKSVATAILGYQPSVGAWQFFFGVMSAAEVSAKYGRRSA